MAEPIARHLATNAGAARLVGVTEGAIRKAIEAGRVKQYTMADGRKVVDIRQVLKLYPRER